MRAGGAASVEPPDQSDWADKAITTMSLGGEEKATVHAGSVPKKKTTTTTKTYERTFTLTHAAKLSRAMACRRSRHGPKETESGTLPRCGAAPLFRESLAAAATNRRTTAARLPNRFSSSASDVVSSCLMHAVHNYLYTIVIHTFAARSRFGTAWMSLVSKPSLAYITPMFDWLRELSCPLIGTRLYIQVN